MSFLRRSDPNLRAVRPNPQSSEAAPAPARPPAPQNRRAGDQFNAAAAPAAVATFRQSVAPEQAIPDLSKTTSSLRFDDKAAISQLKISLEVEHSWRGDLVVSLTSPSGKSAQLSNRAGGSANDLKLQLDLAQFQGEPLQGEWTLTIEDKAKRDTGTLRSWSLEATASPAPPPPATPNTVRISSFDDDPMVQAAHVEQLAKSAFQLGNDGIPTGLVGPKVKMVESPVIAQMSDLGNLTPFATNPWSLPAPGADGAFEFAGEERFPKHQTELGPDGKVLKNEAGLQVWKPRTEHLAQATAFEAANTVHSLSEGWAGQPISWGQDGQMAIDAHSFIGVNANYSPLDRSLRFGVVPYKTAEGELRLFEMASSWEVVAHESGHAVQDVLKPHKGLVDLGYRQWGESFGDQLSMWGSLEDPERVAALLEETGGDFSRSNALSRIAEAYGTLNGTPGGALRDAVNTLKVSDTSTQFHERSEVLTGAAYQVFQGVFQGLVQEGRAPAEALREAGNVMGTFLMRTTQHTPENAMTLEDVGKAYLKVDQEYFGGKYRALLEGELTTRGILTPASLKAHAAHEAMTPKLVLTDRSREGTSKLLKDHQEQLNLGGGFGGKLTSFHTDDLGQTVVRFQLERGGAVANNHAVMVFRADGSLMDYQNPMPASLEPAKAAALLDQARSLGLHRQGTLQLVERPEGGFTVQAVREERRGSDPHLQVFTLENPRGARAEYFHVERAREHLVPPALLSQGTRILTAAELV